LIISKVFDKKTALIFLALWAVNQLAVSIDTIAWNPVVIPLLFILLIYSVYLYFKNQKTKYVFLTGLIFGLGVSFHLQFLFIAPIFIPLLIDVIKSKRFKDLACLVGGSIVPFFPILIFDLRHNFLNLSQMVRFVKSGNIGINRVFYVWERVCTFMVGGSPSKILGLIIYLLVLVGLFILGRKSGDKIQSKLLSGLGFVWMLSLPLFYLFIKNPSEYYFNYLLMPFILFLSLFLRIWKRFGILVLVGIVVYFIFLARPSLDDLALNLREKDQAVTLLGKITNSSSPFNISFDVPFNEDSGFRYLLNYRKVRYSGSANDPLIEFIIPSQKRINTFTSGRIGIFIPADWLKTNWPGKSK